MWACPVAQNSRPGMLWPTRLRVGVCRLGDSCDCAICIPKASPGFRADMLGQFVWKYSEDAGLTWSAKHFVIPVPHGYIETINSWNGSVQVRQLFHHFGTISQRGEF